MKKQYSGRDGSFSKGSRSSEGVNKITSAGIGTSQKVRSGEKSQKTYKKPVIDAKGDQVYMDWRPAGMTQSTYTIKGGKKK